MSSRLNSVKILCLFSGLRNRRRAFRERTLPHTCVHYPGRGRKGLRTKGPTESLPGLVLVHERCNLCYRLQPRSDNPISHRSYAYFLSLRRESHSGQAFTNARCDARVEITTSLVIPWSVPLKQRPLFSYDCIVGKIRPMAICAF
jgi:hypothetical protein